ncbi:MAG TPA: hypothetical protein VEA61_08280 [Allosphingosinicella sp.]|nr:hypothetical protein [Allosphingosinicella sp.]
MPNFSFQSGRAFDAGLAALAAVSVGFVTFAMPDALFSELVQASHLPNLVAAARPPLGDTARSAAVSAAVLFTFAAVWALMAALDRVPARAKAAPEPEAEAPRLRRADAHPDAPARRPLLARDLGEPLELEPSMAAPAVEPPAVEAPARPLPAFLVPQEPEPAVEIEPEPAAEAEPETPAETATDPRAEREPGEMPISELAARLPEAGEESDQSLSQLVNRIECGLTRKRQALPVSEPPAEEPPAEEARVGHRLRSAINDLQKIASSGA